MDGANASWIRIVCVRVPVVPRITIVFSLPECDLAVFALLGGGWVRVFGHFFACLSQPRMVEHFMSNDTIGSNHRSLTCCQVGLRDESLEINLYGRVCRPEAGGLPKSLPPQLGIVHNWGLRDTSLGGQAGPKGLNVDRRRGSLGKRGRG